MSRKVGSSGNLDVCPYPFDEGCFNSIYCSHVLEHGADLFRTLDDLFRALWPGRTLHVRVLHFSNGYGYNDLTHRRLFGYFSADGGRILQQNVPVVAMLVSGIVIAISKQLCEHLLCLLLRLGEIGLRLVRTELQGVAE